MVYKGPYVIADQGEDQSIIGREELCHFMHACASGLAWKRRRCDECDFFLNYGPTDVVAGKNCGAERREARENCMDQTTWGGFSTCIRAHPIA